MAVLILTRKSAQFDTRFGAIRRVASSWGEVFIELDDINVGLRLSRQVLVQVEWWRSKSAN